MTPGTKSILPVALRNAVVALPLAIGFVFLEFDAATLLLFFWGIGVLISADLAWHGAQKSVAKVRLATHTVVFALTTAVAAAAPGKRIDQLLTNAVTLERADFTVPDLADYCSEHSSFRGSDQFPLKIYIEVSDSAAGRPIHFSSRTMTLQEFIDSIESQTALRHHFGGCGNAYSVVRGPAYNFGLSFRERDPD